MVKIIEMLYDGKIDPSGYVGSDNPDLQKMIRKSINEWKVFRQNMSEEDAKRFDDLDDLDVNLTFKYAYEYFSYGFKLAVRLMCEVFADDRIFEEQCQLSPSTSLMQAANEES